MTTPFRLFNDAEERQLLLAMGDTFTEDEFLKVMEWAERAALNFALLQSVLDGTITVSVNEAGALVYKSRDAIQ